MQKNARWSPYRMSESEAIRWYLVLYGTKGQRAVSARQGWLEGMGAQVRENWDG
jgi:hypothetical protein